MINISIFQRVTVAVICILGVLYSLPNILPKNIFQSSPEGLPGKTINLGLDLQGGLHLLMKVETDVAVEEMVGNLEGAIRQIIRDEKVFPKGLKSVGMAIEFDVSDNSKLEQIREVIYQSEFGTDIDYLEAGGLRVEINKEAIVKRRTDVIQQALKIIRLRLDPDGTKELTVQQQGTDRILVQVPGADDPEEIKRLLSTTAKLTFHIVHPQVFQRGQRKPAGYLDLPGTKSEGGQRYWVRRLIDVGGDRLVDAQPSFEQNRPVISFRFDTAGAQKFGRVTTRNVGRLLAIVLDNEVISAPRVNEPITGGSGIITGQFTVEETQELALLLRAGALPAPMSFLEERTVGPGLGADSVEAGKYASLLGLVLVVIFMVVVYGRFGLIADVALLFNITIIFALLSVLQATLTLPGIAGIVLTMGMAVDANVLIFERIREETLGGRSPINAIEAGYRRALTTIIDSNLTTLIAAVLLFAFGSGPIKGFAVTLSIGILTSMFTAIMVTRLLIVFWVKRSRPQTLPI
ncbi:MAG: protein translocase subunit SecD [Rhodospirillaceae bacterium]|jgi:preprotein translocase subunit SecD|nr:protein translocase subunit SecD [Rhodospirillaceae bacterium]